MRKKYEQTMANYIGAVFGTSWAPIPGVATATNIIAELELERVGFQAFMPDVENTCQKNVMRFYKKRTFALNMGGMIPYAGPVLAILDIWGRGRYIIRLAEEHEKDKNFFDDSWLVKIKDFWPTFEPELWDGEVIISFYQRTTGMMVSREVHDIFIKTLGEIGRIYNEKVKTIEGFENMQDQGEELLYKASEGVKEGAKVVGNMLKKWFK